MFGLGQKVSLESFQLCYLKCRDQIKNSHSVMNIIFWNFATFKKSLDSSKAVLNI